MHGEVLSLNDTVERESALINEALEPVERVIPKAKLARQQMREALQSAKLARLADTDQVQLELPTQKETKVTIWGTFYGPTISKEVRDHLEWSANWLYGTGFSGYRNMGVE